MPNEKYFPWESFQLWLHEGIVAGRILNRIIMESWPGEKKGSYQASIANEQHEFLNAIKSWAKQNSKPRFCEVVDLVLQSEPAYPKLNDEQAQLLFEAVSEYGTASRRFVEKVLPALKEYMASFSDSEAGLKQEFDAIWRSIGPSLSPDRTGLTEE